MAKFKSTFKNETVYVDGVAIQFNDYVYSTDDKKLQTSLSKVSGVTKVEEKKDEASKNPTEPTKSPINKD